MEINAYVGNADVEIDDDEIRQVCRDSFGPDEVYNDGDLAAWAEENGWIRKEDAHKYLLEHVKK